ncbi:Uncaracterized surface protein containing fasciclin (FAS1) repeats [Erythrobacter litoralis]|uniref:Beta-Ig-H3/fasciclin n=1 Tax=Erythrobacter litoralis TaxID=39960 RepID=A0A074M935_9SPHN|nr:fasciclin domain-containing protein [Erythrobacter litoralis]AOL22706.1 Uncaracterized surface protein containing fasciclin (FAS1) repeats [Erythrobacter litoralis]KEO89929.1 beta-Ig-H3/fasciclin [Erythrobacter litoralis]MEE4338244.1 fasciclin domain-containing protein [Erythrobacter sp.]
MKMLKITLASAIALGLAACAEEAAETDDMMADETAMAEDATAPGTIPEVAEGDGNFTTLVAAVGAAELGETLSGEGPFTVFAPTDEAFAKLPEGTVEALTTEETDKLKSILTYHVVEGAMDAAAVTSAIEDAGEEGLVVETVGGGTFTATLVDGQVMITDAAGNTATVTATDVEASNGVIHVIDTVLMPE